MDAKDRFAKRVAEYMATHVCDEKCRLRHAAKSEAMSKEEFAEKIAGYVETHLQYDQMSKKDAAIAAIIVLTSDMGAANDYLKVIGVDIDLYTYHFKGE